MTPRKVLVLAPHPDDDALGCGGAIRKHVLDGDLVATVYLTSGELGCSGEDPAAAALREREAGESAQVLETYGHTFWRYPDGKLALHEGELTERLVALYHDPAPDLIYAPHPADGHPDHGTAGRVALAFAGVVRAPLRLYEVWTPLPFVDLCLDITEVVTAKRGAIRAHRSQVSRNGFDEAILALNHYRGLMHGPNVMYAEAYRVMR